VSVRLSVRLSGPKSKTKGHSKLEIGRKEATGDRKVKGQGHQAA